jgi:hypothetical protein
VATAGGAIVASDGWTGASVYCGGAAGCGRCETCDSGGTCVAAPNPTCDQASLRSRLKIKNSTQDGSDRLRWRWQADGFAFTFGDPLAGTDYNVCVWEPSDTLVFAATAPAGGDCNGSPCWRQSGDRTATYTNGAATPDGLVNLQVNDTNFRGTASVNGKGPLLSARPFGLPSTPAPFGLPLRVQIEAEDLWCGEAQYPTAKRNTGEIFQARTE